MQKQYSGRIEELIKNQKYNIIINMGRDKATKKYPRKTRIFYGTKKEAEIYLRNWLWELEHPEEMLSEETVGDWLDTWLDNDAKLLLKWEQNTERRARGIVENNIKPHIGDKFLVMLSPDDILEMYGKLGKDGGRNGRSLSQRSLRYIHTILNQALKQAIVRNKIRNNPAQGLTPASQKGKSKDKWVVLDTEQLAKFLFAIQGESDYYLIYLAAHTGARQSELLGLKWANVWGNKKAIRIEAALHKTYNKENKEVFELRERTKNATSTRTVDISDQVVFALNLHREIQKSKGIGVGPKDFVFANQDGKPVDADALSARYRKLAKKYGHDGMTFHHLRHTHATILLSDGAYVNEVAARLGHADPRITLAIYGHVIPKKNYTLADHFDKLLNPPPPETKPENKPEKEFDKPE